MKRKPKPKPKPRIEPIAHGMTQDQDAVWKFLHGGCTRCSRNGACEIEYAAAVYVTNQGADLPHMIVVTSRDVYCVAGDIKHLS